jgi:hypothetical protein
VALHEVRIFVRRKEDGAQWCSGAAPQPKKRLTAEAKEVTEKRLRVIVYVVSVSSVVRLFFAARQAPGNWW